MYFIEGIYMKVILLKVYSLDKHKHKVECSICGMEIENKLYYYRIQINEHKHITIGLCNKEICLNISILRASNDL